MKTAKQPIEAAGLLSKIGEMFFKGLDGLMNSAAEYEEDFGVLKQVTRIPLTDKTSGRKMGTLTIKLAPVKNKEGLYYVEAETDAPGFNVSSINGKTMKLDKNNMASFEKMIDKLISDNNLAPEKKDENTEDEEGGEEERAEEQEVTESEKAEAAEAEKELNKYAGSHKFTCMSAEGEVFVVADYELTADDTEMTIKLHVEDQEGNVLDSYPEDMQSYSIKGKDGSVISITKFRNITRDQFKAYIANNNIESLEEGTFASSSVKATFIKSSETNDIELTAITASCDLDKAMDIIYAIAEDDDFADTLSDNPQSFEIVEVDDGYDVSPIDGVDTSDTYCKIFKSACDVQGLFVTVRWIIGEEEFYKLSSLNTLYYTITDLVNKSACWLLQKTKCLPIPTVGYTQDEIVDMAGDLTSGNLATYAVEQCYNCFNTLDNLYVNLDHVEQNDADLIISAARANLAHVGYKF